MDNYEEEIVEETTETPEEVAEIVVEETTEEPEEVIDWEARAKKAEAAIIKAKSKPKTEAPKVEGKLSTFDLLALQKANIETEEDLDEVMQFAGYKNISVAEALKSNILKTVLSEKAEERKSAMAVNTGTGRRPGSGHVSDERLLADAEKGIMPNEADIGRLAVLRMKKR